MAVFNTTTPILRIINSFTSASGTYTHYATDWIIAEKSTGKVVWESLDNQVALTSISVPPGKLKENTDYNVYSRFKGVDNTGTVFDYSPYSVLEVSIGSVKVAPPVINASGAPNNLPSDPDITTNNMVVLVGTDTHFATDWYVEALDGSIVFQSPTDSVNKTSIKLPEGTLMPQTSYRIRVRHIGSNSASPFAEEIFTTQAKALSPPDIDIEGEPDAIDNAPRFLTSPFDMVIGTDTHQQTLWELLDDANQIVFSRQENSNIAGNPGLTTIDLNTLGVTLNWDTVYTIRVTYYGVTVQATATKQFRVMREPLQIVTPTITVEGEATNEILTNPLLTTTPFVSNYAADTHLQTDWRIFEADPSGNVPVGASPIHSATVLLPDDLENYRPPLKTLNPNTTYVIEVKVRGTVLVDGQQVNAESAWGSHTITTANITLSTPVVQIDGSSDPTMVIGATTAEIISSAPELTINPPPTDSPANSSPHVETSWRIWATDPAGNKSGQPKWESLNNSQDLLSITVPNGILNIGANYYYVLEVTAHGTVVDSAVAVQRFKPNLKIDAPTYVPVTGSTVTTNTPTINIDPMVVTPPGANITSVTLTIEVRNANGDLYESTIINNASNGVSFTVGSIANGPGAAPDYGEDFTISSYFSGDYNGKSVSSNTGTATYTIPGVSIGDPNLVFNTANSDPNALPRNPLLNVAAFIVTPSQSLATYVDSLFTVEEIDAQGNTVNGGFSYTTVIDLGYNTNNNPKVIDTSTLPGWPSGGLSRGKDYRFSIVHNATKTTDNTSITSNVSSITGTVPTISISQPTVTLYKNISNNSLVPINSNINKYYEVPNTIDLKGSPFSASPAGVTHDRSVWKVGVYDAQGNVTWSTLATVNASAQTTATDMTTLNNVDVTPYIGKEVVFVVEYTSESTTVSSYGGVNEKHALISSISAPTLGPLYTLNSSGTAFVQVTDTNNVPINSLFVGVPSLIEATPSGSDVYSGNNDAMTVSVPDGNTMYVYNTPLMTLGNVSVVPLVDSNGPLEYGTTYSNISVSARGASGRTGPATTVSEFTTVQQPTVGNVGLSINYVDNANALTGQNGNAESSLGGSEVVITITGAVNVGNANLQLINVDQGFNNSIYSRNINLSSGSASVTIYLPIVLSAGATYEFHATVTDASDSSNKAISNTVTGPAVTISALALVAPGDLEPNVPLNPTYTVNGTNAANYPTAPNWTIQDTLDIIPSLGSIIKEYITHTTLNNTTDVSTQGSNQLSYGTTYTYKGAARALMKGSNVSVTAGTPSGTFTFYTVPKTDIWVDMAVTNSDLPDDLYSHASVMVGGYIYIGGGQGDNPATGVNDNSPPIIDSTNTESPNDRSSLNAMFKRITPSSTAASAAVHAKGKFYNTISGGADIRLANSSKQATARLPEYSGNGTTVVDAFLYTVGGVEERLDANNTAVISVSNRMYYTPAGVVSAFSTGTVPAWREKVLPRNCYSGAATGETDKIWLHVGGFVSLAPLDNPSYSNNNVAVDSATALDLRVGANGQTAEQPFILRYDRATGGITSINGSSVVQSNADLTLGRLINIAEHSMTLTASGIIVIVGGMALYENNTSAIFNDRVLLLVPGSGSSFTLYRGPVIPASLRPTQPGGLRSIVSLSSMEYLGGDTVVLSTNGADGYVVYMQSTAFATGGTANNGNIAINWFKGLNRTAPVNSNGGGLGTAGESSYGAYGRMTRDMVVNPNGPIELYFTGGINPAAPTFNNKLAVAKYTPNQIDTNGNLVTTGLTAI